MQANLNEIEINGKIYVSKDSIRGNCMAQKFDNMEYCVVRTFSAGVFAGYIESRDGKEVVLRHARRIWKWAGAASLSQLAVDGTNAPNECMFPMPVDKVILTEAIEIIPTTQKAKESIEAVPVWKK